MSMPTTAATPAPATTAPQNVQVQQAASTSRPLDPLLVLAGLVAGVAVVCLLLVGSRAAQADGGGEARS
jgi:multisubunit Na+/H+ antiporter MnhC subunit